MNISNALSNAAKSLEGNVRGLFNGNNLPIQPQIATVFSTNIPAVPLVSTRDYFLAQLNSWLTTPSLNSQWVVVIDGFPRALNSSIIRNLERTAGNNNAFDIDSAVSTLASYPFQKVAGCVFANKVKMPGETFKVSTVSIDNNRGFIPGIAGGDRGGPGEDQLSIDFIETNTSFTDFVFRPWVILASHYGLMTREDEYYNVKTNITVIQYGKTFQNISMIPRKVFRFFNCVPTQVPTENLSYEQENSVQTSTVNFAYTNYTIENSLYLPLPQIIASIKSGKSSFDIPSPLLKKR